MSESQGGRPDYWPYYCEENIWHRCSELPEDDSRSLVAFVSNATRSVAVWCQRAAEHSEHPILWDYHVILLRHRDDTWQVIDPDCMLGPEIAADRYLEAAFRALPAEHDRLAPMFRLIPAETYRFSLHTDRRHMLDSHGAWRAAPPPWPPIGRGSNLEQFIDMEAPFLGRVVDLPELRRTLGV